jgi:CO/xanthine dehydrogenase FAD-binding subunit
MDLISVRTVRVPQRRDQLALAPGEVTLGGGTWLFSEPQPGVTGLVDLTGLGWTPLTATDAGLSIAATCTFAELAAVPAGAHGPATSLFRACCDALLGSPAVQHSATVGGNVCLALPAGPVIALAAVLDADALVWTPDGAERTVPVADLVLGVRRTGLRAGEVLRSVEVPRHALACRTALRRIALSPLGRSGALVAGRVDAEGRTVVAVTASTPRPYVLRFDRPPRPGELADAVHAVDDWYDDPHGAPDWRRAMTLRLAEQVRTELAAPPASPAPAGARP